MVLFCACRHFNDDPADLPVNLGLADDFYAEAFEMEEKKDEVPVSLWMGML